MKKDRTKSDVRLKEFWRDRERFADLFNGVLFGGEPILMPEDLQEADTDVSGIFRLKEYEESLAKSRDVVMKSAHGIDFIICGLENQRKVHYAMPLRTLLYDGMGYLKEYQTLARGREEKKGMSPEEFLSKMRREDRLHPIVSLVVYYGETPWDGPHCLKDMVVGMPEPIEKIFSDYRMNLLQVRESGAYVFHNEDVKTVFALIRDIFEGNFEKVQEEYKDRGISAELAKVVSKITNLEDFIEIGEGEEETNMCSALEKLRQSCIEQGRIVGIEEGMEQGIQLGTDRGIEQGVKKAKTALIFRWTKEGRATAEIADLLAISEEEVRELQAADR